MKYQYININLKRQNFQKLFNLLYKFPLIDSPIVLCFHASMRMLSKYDEIVRLRTSEREGGERIDLTIDR